MLPHTGSSLLMDAKLSGLEISRGFKKPLSDEAESGLLELEVSVCSLLRIEKQAGLTELKLSKKAAANAAR